MNGGNRIPLVAKGTGGLCSNGHCYLQRLSALGNLVCGQRNRNGGLPIGSNGYRPSQLPAYDVTGGDACSRQGVGH